MSVLTRIAARSPSAVRIFALINALGCYLSVSAHATSCDKEVVARNPISRGPRLLDLSRPGDPVCRQILERAGHFGADDRRGDRLRSAQRGRGDGFAATRSECRGSWGLLFCRSGRARGFDLCRPRNRNLSLQLLAVRDVGLPRRGQDLRPLRLKCVACRRTVQRRTSSSAARRPRRSRPETTSGHGVRTS